MGGRGLLNIGHCAEDGLVHRVLLKYVILDVAADVVKILRLQTIFELIRCLASDICHSVDDLLLVIDKDE